MKYIADVLTALRAILALVVLWAGLTHHWGITMTAFIIGILSDAVDGPAARRWPYSVEENQQFFWRRKGPHAWDNAADFLLSNAGLIVVTFGLLSLRSSVAIVLVVLIGGGCFVFLLQRAIRCGRPKLAERIDVAFGWAAALQLATILVVMTIQATDWWKLWLVAYAVVGLILLRFKWDRATSRPEVNYDRP